MGDLWGRDPEETEEAIAAIDEVTGPPESDLRPEARAAIEAKRAADAEAAAAASYVDPDCEKRTYTEEVVAFRTDKRRFVGGRGTSRFADPGQWVICSDRPPYRVLSDTEFRKRYTKK